jgi:hypothetical protein
MADFGGCRWMDWIGEGLREAADVVMIVVLALGSPRTIQLSPRHARKGLRLASFIEVLRWETKLRVARDCFSQTRAKIRTRICAEAVPLKVAKRAILEPDDAL